MPKLSIIIVSYNTCHLLQSCLESVFKQEDFNDCEVIVVDNCSTDGSIEMLQSHFAQVKLIVNQENRGFAAANNIGLSYATGKYILLLNPDTELESNVLLKCLSFLKQNQDVGVLGCKIVNPDGSIQPSARDKPSLWTLILENSFLYKLLPHSGIFRNPWVTDTDKEQNVDVVKGAFLMTRRTIFETVGLFDERFFLYSEEQDWCVRVKEEGWRIVYFPEARIKHYEGASSKPGLNSSKYIIYESECEYYRKHHGSIYANIALAIIWAGILLRFIVWSVILFVSILGFAHHPEASERPRHYWYTLVRLARYSFRTHRHQQRAISSI
jgi:GT2 family glycosyltransferase